jgi:DNA sulfur modification protein DndD
MIIKKISLENFLCYYGVKEFELSNGLNVILGNNGEGKTKFFEAVDWLFNGDDRNLDLLVSAKALHETEKNESFRVRVSIDVEQYNEKKSIAKSFIVKKGGKNESLISNYMLEGVEETSTGERCQVDGKSLLNRVFPFQIRKYSMFKGESELNIFKNEDALINLINLFSDAKHFEKYSEKCAFLRDKAEKAVEDATKCDKKNQGLYKKLTSEIEDLKNEEYKIRVHLNSVEEQIAKIEGKLQEAECHVKNADALETINKRIKIIEGKISDINKMIDENYTTSLFDENWILVNFEPIQKEFSEKIEKLNIKKRELQSEFDRQIGQKEGEKKAKTELLNNLIPLPVGVPSKAYMEEMLKDEFCKVCNRPAPKGSEQYDFMSKRLEEYLNSQAPVEEDKSIKVLFENDYTNRLSTLSVSHEDNLANLRKIRFKIKQLFRFNDSRKKDVEEQILALEKEKADRERIIGDSSIGAEKLIDVLKNYNSWQADKTLRYKEKIDYQKKLDDNIELIKKKTEEKENIDLKTAQTFQIKTREILRDIEKIFVETKEKKFDGFIDQLEKKSNSIFESLNIESFTGTIYFNKKVIGEKMSVIPELQENGRTFYKPNQSLLTSMHISILFAISELAFEKSEEEYPVIFDAPTSSFGEDKTFQFLNLIYETENQKILLIKDFLATDKTSNKLVIKKEFSNVNRNKAFWVVLERPFDKNNLSTINTNVITL